MTGCTDCEYYRDMLARAKEETDKALDLALTEFGDDFLQHLRYAQALLQKAIEVTAHVSTAVTLEQRIVRIERLLALMMVQVHRPGNVEAARKLMRSDDPLLLAIELTKPER